MGTLGTYTPASGSVKMISERQLPWLLDMTREFWTLSATITGENVTAKLEQALTDVERMTSREASARITELKDDLLPILRQTARYAAKNVERPVSASAPVELDTDGIYVIDGGYYRVRRSGQGNLYALKLDTVSRSWEYVRGMVSRIRPEHRITAEHAARLPFSWCIRCARELSREDSIARRMGPVCYAKSIG